MRGKKIKSKTSIIKYLPVLLILLSITIMVGSTFAYFTDRKDTSSDLSFSKVELSSETTLGINGELRDVIPGSKIVDGAVAFSKAIDSEAIYVRAKVSFTLPEEYEDDADMVELVRLLTKSSDFNIVEDEQNGAVWSEKDGNYFYLLDNDDTTKLMRVDNIDTYVLSNEIIIPRELEQLEDNKQYMKSINFHIAFEAIQADNVSDVLTETKTVFDAIFPITQIEDKYSPTFDVIFTGADKETVFNVTKVEEGKTLIEPTQTPEGASEREIFEGWYKDKELTTPFDFNEPIIGDITLYPKYTIGDTLTIMSEDGQTVVTKVFVPAGEKTAEPTGTSAYVDENGTTTHVMVGYYTDSNFTNKFEFGTTIDKSYTIYPQLLAVSEGLEFTPLIEAVTTSNSPDFRLSNEGTTSYSVAKGNCNDDIVVIPDYYLGKPVTQVSENGFKDGTNITYIHLPNTLHTINAYAFQNCSNMDTKIPTSVKVFGTYAFYSCSKLTKIYISEDVTKLENYTFYNCRLVTEIVFNAKNMQDLLNKNYVFYNVGSGTDGAILNIGASVTKIPAYIFNPYNVSSSVEDAYTYSPNIKTVNFEEGSICKSIGKSAFRACFGLMYLTIPSSVTSIGTHAFYLTTNLTRLNYNATNIADFTENNYMFYGTALSSKNLTVHIGANVERIPAYLFRPRTSLSLYDPYIVTISFEEGSVCESVGKMAFYGTDVEYLTIPSNIKTIEQEAFGNSSKLKEVYFNATNMNDVPSSYKIFDLVGYNNKVDGTTIIIGANVERIPAYVFYGNANSSTIPTFYTVKFAEGSVCKSIGKSVFGTCKDLSNLYIPNLTMWLEMEFEDVSANPLYYAENLYVDNELIVDLIIPDGVTEIGNYAFYNCESIKNVTIPDGVTTIGEYAFYGCKGIKRVNLSEDTTKISQYAFYNCMALSSINTENVTYIGKQSFYNCINLTTITISSDIATFGEKAFEQCYKLIEVVNLSTSNIKTGNSSYGYVAYYANNVCSSVEDSCISITADGFKFYSKDTRTNFIEYVGTNTDIVFPDNFNGKNYTIYQYALYNCDNITSITTSTGVTLIGNYAFYGCDSLVTVNIKDGVTSIGTNAFNYCLSLKSVTIPSTVTSIGSGSFHYCKVLETINFNATNMNDITSTTNTIISNTGIDGEGITLNIGKNVTKIPAYLFYSNTNSVFNSNFVAVNFESGSMCTSIGKFAFANITTLTGMTIPSSVVSIGEAVFSGCSGMINMVVDSNNDVFTSKDSQGNEVNAIITKDTNILVAGFLSTNIPNNITSIASHAFYELKDLASIEIPNSVTSIGNEAFSRCSNLTEVIISSESLLTSIGNYAFYNCTKLTSIVLPGSVSAIGKDAFTNSGITFETTDSVKYLTLANNTTFVILYANRSITSITWPSDVVGIAGGAFASCTSLTSVEIPSTILNINEYTFNGCTKLVSVEIPSSITEISNYAFAGCSQLASVTFANESQLTTIGDYAFQNCTALISILIPSNVVNIKDYAFSGCNQLASIDFSANSKLEVLGNYVFQNCSKLTSINFANVNKLTTIGNYAFGSCSILPTIIIPSSVESIGEYAFYSCYKLDSVDFANDSKLTTIAQRVFAYCNVLTSVVIPRGLTTISEYAFNGCNKLATIKYMGTPNEFELIVVGANNTNFTSAKVVYYYGWNVTSRIDPTCTADGFEAYEKDGETGQIVLPMIPHDYEDAVCSICGKEAVTIVTEISEGTYGFINSDGTYTSNNKGKGSSNAYATITAYKACEIVITWTVSSQANYDKFYIYVNNTVQSTVNGVSGIKNGTLTLTLAVGDVVKLRYYKNTSTNSNNDCATFTYIETEITE